MFRKRRSIPEVAPSNGEGELPAAAPSMPPPPPPVRAILVGPPGETRDWLESFISARPEMRLLGTHTHPEDAVTALKESAGRQAAAVLIDATLREPNEARSVIRTVRDRFPALRIVAYGDDLDEIAIEGLYFIGADAVLLRQMEREEVITAILKSVRKPVNAGTPKIREPEVEVAKEAPRPDSDIVHVGERAQVIGEVTEAIEEPIPAMVEPALAMEEPTPAVEERIQAIWGSRTPAMEEPAPPMEEPVPALGEPAPALGEPTPTMEEPIEYFHKHKQSIVVQREIGVDVPNFSEALRRALRQDPDVMLVGEMRDLATISAAITAAETGHLVFGTLHTSGAASTILGTATPLSSWRTASIPRSCRSV